MFKSLLNKAAGLQSCRFIKKRLQRKCFFVNITKLLRTRILKNVCERLLLHHIFGYLKSLFDDYETEQILKKGLLKKFENKLDFIF